MDGRLGIVDEHITVPHQGNPEPAYHEVCVTATDHKARIFHRNIDICHLLPQPPRKKGQYFLVLRCAEYPEFEGPYRADLVQTKKKAITVWHGGRGKKAIFNSDYTVRVLQYGEDV